MFTDQKRSESNHNKTWDVTQNGFWNEKPYIELAQTFKYEESDVYLDQSIIIDSQNNISLHRNYEHFYTKKTITNVLDAFHFKNHYYYSDVTGKLYNKKSKTLALVSKK